MPATRSGAPPSSVLMCAVVAQITAPQRGSIERRPVTFAPVPLKTGNASAPRPKCSPTTSCSRAVYASPPYATWCPPFAAAMASSTSGWIPE